MLRRSFHVVEIWATVLRSWVGLRLWPESELAYAFAAGTGGHASDPSLVAAFRSATNAIAPGRCVLMSVALLRLLRRRRMDAVLRIGLELNGRKISGHAWVESREKVQGDAATIADRFKPFNITAAGLAEFLSCRRTRRTTREDSLEFSSTE